MGIVLQRTLSAGFIAPCLPLTPSDRQPARSGFTKSTRRLSDDVPARGQRRAAAHPQRTRLGTTLPAVIEAVAALRVRSCLLDGEAVYCDENGVALFAKLRQRRNDRHVILRAFDLLELDGKDLRREPLERRKVLLVRLQNISGVALSELAKRARLYVPRPVWEGA